MMIVCFHSVLQIWGRAAGSSNKSLSSLGRMLSVLYRTLGTTWACFLPLLYHSGLSVHILDAAQPWDVPILDNVSRKFTHLLIWRKANPANANKQWQLRGRDLYPSSERLRRRFLCPVQPFAWVGHRRSPVKLWSLNRYPPPFNLTKGQLSLPHLYDGHPGVLSTPGPMIVAWLFGNYLSASHSSLRMFRSIHTTTSPPSHSFRFWMVEPEEESDSNLDVGRMQHPRSSLFPHTVRVRPAHLLNFQVLHCTFPAHPCRTDYSWHRYTGIDYHLNLLYFIEILWVVV